MGWWSDFLANRRRRRELQALEEIKKTLQAQDIQVRKLSVICDQMEQHITTGNFENLLGLYKEFEAELHSLHDKESFIEALDHKILRGSVFRQLRKIMK